MQKKDLILAALQSLKAKYLKLPSLFYTWSELQLNLFFIGNHAVSFDRT